VARPHWSAESIMAPTAAAGHTLGEVRINDRRSRVRPKFPGGKFPDGREVPVVTTFVMVGVGLLIMLALIVEICDATTASWWRLLAAERRKRWETRMAAVSRTTPVRRPPSRVP
jgi:hypothetical protein